MTQLQFLTQPSLAPALMRALFLPRKGYQSGGVWPKIQGQLGPITIDVTTLKKYAEVCQLEVNTELPLLYPHVLASRLHMHMLSNKSFPLKLLGAVHLRNKIVQHQAIKVEDPLLFKVEFKDPVITAKGIEFDFETKAYVNSTLVWESLTTYYKAGRFGTPTQADAAAVMNNLENTKEVTRWFLKKNLGKAYAKVCNDYNPIHTSKTLAKLFGFKRDVAHGMGVLATALFRLPQTNKNYPIVNEVIFKGPLFLENEVRVVESDQHSGRYDIYCGKNTRPSICFSTL